MADLRYTVDIDTKGAQSSLSRLRNNILGIGASLGVAFGAREIIQIASRFEDLRTTLGILYKDTATGAQAFEQIKEFATESVFSVEALTASVVKLKAAGLEPSIQQLRLFADVASVSSDSLGALQAITDLFARTTEGGLGLEDLNRLADRGIPVFKILGETLGLGRLEISKFGQSAEGAQIILQALTEGLERQFGGASSNRVNNLSQAFSNLQDAIANTADVIGQAGLNKTISEAVKRFTEFLEANRAVIKTIAENFVQALVILGENLKYIAALMAAVFAAAIVSKIGAIIVAVYNFAKALKAAAIAGAILQGVTGVGLVKLAAGLAGTAAAIATITSLSGDASASIKQVEKDIENLKNAGDGPLSLPSAPDGLPGVETATQQFEELKNKQAELTKASISYFKQYKDSVKDVRAKVQQEQELVGLTESQANVQRELNAFTQQYYDTIRPLQQQVIELKAKDTEESRVQSAEIERQIGLITNLYNESIGGLKSELQLREKNRQEEESLQLLLNNRLKFQKELRDLERESRNALKDLNLTPFEREIEGIKRDLDDKLIKSFYDLKVAWKNGLISSDQYIAEMKKLETQADKTFEVLKKNAEQQREIQRSFAYGWKNAFQEYADEATNAAKKAERIFEKTTSGMEDLIVNFAKTGKFEFRGFVNSILEELLRSQVRELIASVFSVGKSSGGGSKSILGSLFAGFFATGGMIPPGRVGVVGESGPELVSGPADVTPLGNTSVTYNINAVDAASFKQLVAQDPSFIFAVTEQGRKALPQGRR